MQVDSFLQLIDAVRPTRHGWKARCPAHDDKVPSLAISEGTDGRILLRCWTGCTASEIVTALGLTFSDLFPTNKLSSRERSQIIRQRETKKLQEAREYEQIGASIDVIREAEQLIASAKNIDTSLWSYTYMQGALNRLANAYHVLKQAGILYGAP